MWCNLLFSFSSHGVGGDAVRLADGQNKEQTAGQRNNQVKKKPCCRFHNYELYCSALAILFLVE